MSNECRLSEVMQYCTISKYMIKSSCSPLGFCFTGCTSSTCCREGETGFEAEGEYVVSVIVVHSPLSHCLENLAVAE